MTCDHAAAREADPGIGLYYYRARYYDPKIGRFVSEDPIGLDGGINFYAYTENSPTDATDPSGLRLLLCSRRAQGLPGNHAYYWNEGAASGVAHGYNCGRGPNNGREQGPKAKGNYCVEVPGSEGKEAAILQCCRTDKANDPILRIGGTTVVNMIPTVNDCHNLIENCLKKNGVANPGAPGGRTGCPDPSGQCAPTPQPAPPPPPR